MRIPTRLSPDSGGAALVTNRVISTVPCKLMAVYVFNNGADQYFQIHNASTLPADDAVPAVPSFKVNGGSFGGVDFGVVGLDLDACTVCRSSAPEKKTIGAGAADVSIVAILAG